MLSMKKAPIPAALRGDTGTGALEGMCKHTIISPAVREVPARVNSYQKATCQGPIVVYGGLFALTHGEGWGSVKAPYPTEALQTPFQSPKERKKHKKSIAAHTCESFIFPLGFYPAGGMSILAGLYRPVSARTGCLSRARERYRPASFRLNPYPTEVPFHA